MKKKNIAVIGAGRIGQIHAKNVFESLRANLYMVSDPIEKALDNFKKIGIKTTTNVDETINDDNVDAVIVGAPTPLHVDLIKKCVVAGKPVMCEKPIDLDVKRAKSCVDIVKKSGVKVMLGFNRRFDPTFGKIHQLVEQGEIGNLEQVIIISRDPEGPPLEYIKISGGIFKDMTIHDFDMARFFIGNVKRVHAFGQNRIYPEFEEAGDFDSAVISLISDDGKVANIINSRRDESGYDQRLEAFGEKGMLEGKNHTETTVHVSKKFLTGAGERFQDFFLDRYALAYKIELNTFLDALGGKPVSYPTVEDGYEALLLAEAATISAKEHREVEVSEIK